MTPAQTVTASAYAALVKTAEAKLVLSDLIAYVHALPETLQLGASHLLTHIQFKALAIERERRRDKKETK